MWQLFRDCADLFTDRKRNELIKKIKSNPIHCRVVPINNCLNFALLIRKVSETRGEIKEGKVGDVLSMYINLKIEDYKDKTLIGRIKKYFGIHRMYYDREYLIKQIERGLNTMLLKW